MRLRWAAQRSVGSPDFFRASEQPAHSSVSGNVSSRRAADFSSSTYSLGNFSGFVTRYLYQMAEVRSRPLPSRTPKTWAAGLSRFPSHPPSLPPDQLFTATPSL